MWIRHWLLVLSLVQIFGGVVVYGLTKAASRADAAIQALWVHSEDRSDTEG